MLSNKDFAKLLSTPSGGGGGGAKDKERFDLKTIKQWDNQIKAKMKNKYNKDDEEEDGSGHARSKGKVGSGAPSGGPDSSSSGYRDRALERRLEANPDYSVSYEAAAKMDVDTSKYFGGDVDHTHLVKGLDHALLQKMKLQKQSLGTAPSTISRDNAAKVSHEYTPVTELGTRLKQVLHNSRTDSHTGNKAGSSVVLSRSRAPLALMACAPAARNAFEIDLDVLSEQDVPTTVLRSAKNIVDNYLGQYVIPPDLLHKLAESLKPENKAKLLAAEKCSKQASSVNKQPMPASKPVIVDTVGDIFEGVGKYTAAIEPEYTASSVSSGAPSASVAINTAIAQKSFDMFGDDAEPMIMPTAPNGGARSDGVAGRTGQKVSYFGGSDSSELKEQSKADLMAPVKELLRNQYLKEQAAAQSKHAVPPVMVEEKGKVHRDVIGGGVAVTDRRYDLAMGSGSYEVAGEMEVFEDDGSDDDVRGGGRSKVGGKSKASASATSANPPKKAKKSSNHFEDD